MFWAIFIVLLVGGFLLYALVDAFKEEINLGLLLLVYFLILIIGIILYVKLILTILIFTIVFTFIIYFFYHKIPFIHLRTCCQYQQRDLQTYN